VSVIIYRTALAPDWIDYNGHLRDAYYGLIVSYACDAMMDRLGMDAAYRQRTGNTLYTVEMHIHFLREVKKQDDVLVAVRLLGYDPKRIHASFDILRELNNQPSRENHPAADNRADANDIGTEARDIVAASAELMLLHVHQGETVATTTFPQEISAAIATLAAATAGAPEVGPGSRRMELRRR
jgi:acyl-CoA thioesterase FadM